MNFLFTLPADIFNLIAKYATNFQQISSYSLPCEGYYCPVHRVVLDYSDKYTYDKYENMRCSECAKEEKIKDYKKETNQLIRDAMEEEDSDEKNEKFGYTKRKKKFREPKFKRPRNNKSLN